MKTTSRRLLRGIAVLSFVATLLTACGGSSGSSGNAETISIVGFSVTEAANKAVAAEWNKTDDGKGVRFKTSYGASGDQSRAVEGGLEADYVHFSVPSDVTRLVDSGQVAKDWNSGKNKGIVSTSVVVFAVRKGNPLGIRDWDDLLKDGVEIVTPNPASSGSARWNALAAWGHISSRGGTDVEAEEFLAKLYAKAVSLPSSGRDATQQFLSGTGNVFITYENEAILTRQAEGTDAFDYVVPQTSILIQNPGAVLTDATPKATDWLKFVLGTEGQHQFALKGFRPVGDPTGSTVTFKVEGANDPSHPFPKVSNLLTVNSDFGSWKELSKKFFDEDNGIITKIIAKSGKGS